MANSRTVSGFPRFARWHRYRDRTESALGSIWLALITPALGAAAGAAWATYLPIHEVVRGRQIDVTTPFWNILVITVVGAILGIALIVSIVLIWQIASYALGGDRSWDVAWPTGVGPSAAIVECVLHPVTKRPVQADDLGSVRAIVRWADGEFWKLDGVHLPPLGDEEGYWFHLVRNTLRPEKGVCHVRWFGTTGRHYIYEIAAKSYDFDRPC